MTKSNKSWTNETNVTKKDLTCSCGKETEIIHCSNHHDGSGIFYTLCECTKQKNVTWKLKNKNKKL